MNACVVFEDGERARGVVRRRLRAERKVEGEAAAAAVPLLPPHPKTQTENRGSR